MRCMKKETKLHPDFDKTGINILLVDDIPANLNVLRATLEPVGYRLSLATSGKDAIEIAALLAPDLILLDIMMPDMNGFETCKRLKDSKDTEHIPIIFLTAKDDLNSLVEAFQAGGVDLVRKPFQMEEVLARVETHLKNTFLNRALISKPRI